MIRFCCTKCGRLYLLADAFAHLPLLCKDCGDRIIVPDPSESLPEPEPEPRHARKPAFERSIQGGSESSGSDSINHDLLLTPTVDDSKVNLFPTSEVRKNLFMPIEGSGEPPLPRLPLPDSALAEPASNSRFLQTDALADIGVFVLLLILGALVGEWIAKKSTMQIFADAPASPKFPPTDLMMWLASVVIFGLFYVWLAARGWSLGGWLKRRR